MSRKVVDTSNFTSPSSSFSSVSRGRKPFTEKMQEQRSVVSKFSQRMLETAENSIHEIDKVQLGVLQESHHQAKAVTEKCIEELENVRCYILESYKKQSENMMGLFAHIEDMEREVSQSTTKGANQMMRDQVEELTELCYNRIDSVVKQQKKQRFEKSPPSVQ